MYSDEPNTIKSWALRKVDSGFVVSDGVGEVMAASCGGGGYHGFLLTGTKDGKVRLTNVLRKIMAPKGVSGFFYFETPSFVSTQTKSGKKYLNSTKILENYLLEEKRPLFISVILREQKLD